MDRLRRILAGGALAAMLGTAVTASGCKSTHNPVPPGPKYGAMGEPPSSAGFNSDPHPYSAMPSPYSNGAPATGGMPQSGLPGSPGLGGGSPGLGGGSAPGSPADGMPPGLGSGGGQSSFGTPTPGSPGMGLPTPNAYGGPGTSGMGR